MDFELTSIRIASQDRAGMRISKTRAFLRENIYAAITHAPVNLTVEPLHHAVEIVIAIPDMVGEPMSDNLILICPAITICVGQHP